ncbi:hypothetical protein VMCG_05716 [Cytospora schulzeri]|uniref:Uncharacterized protein n=1 Tax=Cytospora schulzeri TaxID=448051 RepID=A0A423WI23_9PEZI|nr:hypothetical protein VMCG_05716 [Valsa malicola]
MAIQGVPGVTMQYLLVCDDNVPYTGIDIDLGRQLIKEVDTHQPPVERTEFGISALGTSMVPSKTAEVDWLTGLSNWPLNEESVYAQSSIGLNPVETQMHTVSPGFPHNPAVGVAPADFGNDGLPFSNINQSDENPSAPIPNGSMASAYDTSHPQQPWKLPDVDIDRTQTMPASVSVLGAPSLEDHMFDGLDYTSFAPK